MRMNNKKLILLFFLGPTLFVVALFYIVPLFLSIYISFTPMTDWNVDRYLTQFIGLQNYYRLVHIMMYDPDMRAVVITTIVFVAVTLTINVLGGLLLALATYFMDEKLSMPYQGLWLLPRMTPVAVYSLLWYYFFHSSGIGLLNAILLRLHLIDHPVAWGLDPKYLPWGAWFIIIFINGLVGVSYGMIIFYAAFKSIPKELIIAARIDGASTGRIIRHILLPLTKWHFTFITVWQMFSLLTSFAQTFLLVEWRVVDSTWGQPWALYVFRTAFTTTKDQGLAAAASTLLSAIGIVLGLIALKVLRYKEMILEPKGDI